MKGGGGGCFAWPEGFSSFFDSSIFTHNKGARPLDFISALLSRSDSSEKDRHYFDSFESTSISGTDMLPPELSAHWVLFRSRKNVCYFENARAGIFVWLTRSVNHTMPGPKIFIPGFVTVNRAPVTWFTIVKDRLQSTLG